MGWGGLFRTLWEEGVRKPFRQMWRDARRVWRRSLVFFGPSTSPSPAPAPAKTPPRRAVADALQPRWHLCLGHASQHHPSEDDSAPTRIQQAMRKRRLRLWMINLLFIAPVFVLVSTLLALSFMASASSDRAPSPFLLGVGGVGVLLWWGFLGWARRRARRIAAWYQQDIFDLKERGTPLQRYLQQRLARSSPSPAPGKEETGGLRQVDQITIPEDIEGLKELADLLMMSPLQVAETFLETQLFGPPRGRIRPIALKRSQDLNLHDPTVQTALWLGGPCWWYLDGYSAVVLENPQGFFRILQGPTFPQKVMDHLPPDMDVDTLDARIQKFIPQAFYSWGFERLRRTFRLYPYTVTIKDRWLRSREGIRVKVRQCQVRAVPDFRSPTFLETLCHLVRREAGKDGQSWMEEWLEALQGRTLLQQEIRAAVMGALSGFVRQHTLDQILHAALDLPAQEPSKRLPQREAPGLQALRQRIEQALKSRGFLLEEVITFPQWEIPERLRQQRNARLRQFRDLQQQERKIRETKYAETVQTWLTDHTQKLIPIARRVEAGDPDFLGLVRQALEVMLRTLMEGLDLWEQRASTWYTQSVPDSEPAPPLSDAEAFLHCYRELNTLAKLIHLHIRRPSLRVTSS